MTRSPMSALRRAALPGLVAASALVLGACGTQTAPGGSGGPGGGSGSPTPAAAIDSLDAARAAWSASGLRTGEYQLTITQQCFCQGVSMTSIVKDGRVVDETATTPDGTGTPAPAVVEGFPRTVENLQGVIAGASDAFSTTVTYDRRGVPLRIFIDPIENAIDDESGYVVTLSGVEDREPAAGSGVWTPADLPAGTAFPSDIPGAAQGPGQAVLVRTGTTTHLYLGLWGSGSCPQVPTTLTFGGASEPTQRMAGVIRADVDVDDTTPADQACTADFGPTVYRAEVPAAVAEQLAQPDATSLAAGATLLLVVDAVTGSPGSIRTQSYAVDVAL
ncbi:MAG: DUF6174 domain-containing protein [Candidatus Nanopelagicales bacterium]